MKYWSVTSLREELIKIGVNVVTRSRYVIFQKTEVTVPGEGCRFAGGKFMTR